MIELRNDRLEFSFPEVHELAKLGINFQRTLRIPDNDQVYPLPPGLGSFPLVHVDDHKNKVPGDWIKRGGVIMPMYQAEAMWIYFNPHYGTDRLSSYPFAVKVSTGKIDAITGEPHSNGLHRKPQDYAVVPGQPWLDGYCVKKGMIRQFVAMPLGEGYTAEEQITKKAEYGGLQIVVYPMKAHVFEQRFPRIVRSREIHGLGGWGSAGGASFGMAQDSWAQSSAPPGAPAACAAAPMGLAPGGKMKQEIYQDQFDINDWDTQHFSRCFVHIANSAMWYAITGIMPPHQPPTANDYTYAGLPWFDYYSDQKAIGGSSKLANLKSAQALSQMKGQPIPNKPVVINNTVPLKHGQVREEDW